MLVKIQKGNLFYFMLQIREIFLTCSDTPYLFPLIDSSLPFLLLLCFPFQSMLGKAVVT